MIPHTISLSLELSTSEARRLRWRTSSAGLAELLPLNLPLWVACAWDHQPLGGLLARCDRHLGGVLGRQLKEGQLSLASGEVALVGAAQRLAGAHVLLLGLGEVGPMEPSRAAALGRDTAQRIHKLGTRRYALEAPWSDELPSAEASRIAADFLLAHLRWRLTALGPGGAITVTLVLPEGVRVVDGRARRPVHSRRRRLRTRRHPPFRRSVFPRRRRKK